MNKPAYRQEVISLGINHRKNFAQAESFRAASDKYLTILSGTLGADPSLHAPAKFSTTF